MQPSPELARQVAEVIRHRQTWKVLADPAAPLDIDPAVGRQWDAVVVEAIRTAGWAPFHYDRGLEGLAEPWRVDWLTVDPCRRLADRLPGWFDDLKPNNKLTAMLSACGGLALVSWLPQFEGGDRDDPERASRRQIDHEHLAAASAYVQNLLLLLTAHGLGTYWSSGGQLRDHRTFEQLGLPHRGQLLAAVFVDYSPMIEVSGRDELQRLPGKHRERRDPACGWFHTVPDSWPN